MQGGPESDLTEVTWKEIGPSSYSSLLWSENQTFRLGRPVYHIRSSKFKLIFVGVATWYMKFLLRPASNSAVASRNCAACALETPAPCREYGDFSTTWAAPFLWQIA